MHQWLRTPSTWKSFGDKVDRNRAHEVNSSVGLDLDNVPDAPNEHTEEFVVRLLIEPCFVDEKRTIELIWERHSLY